MTALAHACVLGERADGFGEVDAGDGGEDRLKIFAVAFGHAFNRFAGEGGAERAVERGRGGISSCGR